MGKLSKEMKGSAQSAVIEEKPASRSLLDTMSEEERLQEEANRRKREEFMRVRLKQIQEEEEKYSKYNLPKIMNHWREILRKSKLDELKKSIEVIAQTHDRQVDRKDAVIQMLYRDVMESEEQYRQALRSHLQNVDELLELQKRRMESLEEEFERDLAAIKAEFAKEKQEIVARSEQEKQDIQEIFKEMEKRAEEKSNELLQEFSNSYEEMKTKMHDDTNVMRVLLDGKIKKYQEQIDEEGRTHLEMMDLRYKDFQDQVKKDRDTTEEIVTQTMRIEKFQEELARWKAKLLNNIRECEERNNKLIQEKNALAKHFKHLKNKMMRFRESEAKRLNELVKMAREAQKSLNEKHELGERILHLAELNRKLETERERIMPFEESGVAENAADEEKLSSLQQHTQDGSVQQLDKLQKYYRRYNSVLLHKVALEQEKAYLTEENTKLRMMLKQYLDGISVNEDVLSGDNPLLIVDGASVHQRVPGDVQKSYITILNANEMYNQGLTS